MLANGHHLVTNVGFHGYVHFVGIENTHVRLDQHHDRLPTCTGWSLSYVPAVG